MQFKPTDRILQLGVTPALTNLVKEVYPQASASLWQRNAKTAHRRIVEEAPEVPGEGAFARQGHLLVSLAALLLGFHEGAPADVQVEGVQFGRMVDAALATPVVAILFTGGSPFSSEGLRELEQLLAGATPGLWHGSLRYEDAADGSGQDLVCDVARCGLSALCVREKRHYLLGYLCRLEEAQAGMCGATLERVACIAQGSQRCELRCRAR